MIGDRLGSGEDRRLVEDSIRRALDSFEREDFGGAACALEEALPHLSESAPDLWERLGTAYLKIGDFPRAIDAFERVVAADRATSATFVGLARAASELAHFPDAARYLEAAVDAAPRDAVLWRELGVARRRAGMVVECVACFREALRLGDDDGADSWKELGRALRELGDPSGAIEAYRAAVRCRPRSPELWVEIARLYTETERFGESDDALRESIRLRPNNAAACRAIAQNALKKGERETAERAYRRMKELSPDFAEEIASWVSTTAGLPADAFRVPEVPRPRPAAGRVLRFRVPPGA